MSRLRLASSRGSGPASSRARLFAASCAVNVLPRPEFQADQRPDALRVVPDTDFVLMEKASDLAAVGPAALARAGIDEDVACPADEPFAKPSTQRDTKALLRPRQRFFGQPARDEAPEEPLGRGRAAMAP